MANIFDLSSIALMGSAGFLMIFAAVNAANFRLHEVTRSSKWISAFGALACTAAFIALIGHTVSSSPTQLGFLGLMLSLAILIEIVYRSWARREIHLGSESPGREELTDARGEDSAGRADLRVELRNYFGLSGERPRAIEIPKEGQP